MNQPTSLADGRYLLVKQLGEGGMASVYRAYDQRLQVWRAVKILSPEYADKTNPTPDAAEEGKKLFANHCVTCHGPNADGDSPTGKALTPPASNLTDAKLQDAVKDDYLYWHIAEGGKALGYNGMTPFKDTLKEDQIWQVIAYIRSIKK